MAAAELDPAAEPDEPEAALGEGGKGVTPGPLTPTAATPSGFVAAAGVVVKGIDADAEPAPEDF